MNKEKIISILQLIITVIFVAGIGFLSSVFAGDIQGKYEAMVKAPLAPPAFVFGPVWSVLYLLIAISLFLIIKAHCSKEKRRFAIILFFIQLALNFVWSIVFFGGNFLFGAAVIIILLDISVIACIYYFRKISTKAAVLMVPYLLWILFATYLNIAFAIVN
ncbi:MAG: TspO/MBR family protein [Eubacterium sp.]